MKRLGVGWVFLVAVVLVVTALAWSAGPSVAMQDEEPTPPGVGFLTVVAPQSDPGADPTKPAGEPAGVGFQTAVARIIDEGEEPSPTAAPPSDDDPLAARIGGSRESFEGRYGAPTGGDERTGAFYEVRGYGLVFVVFHDGRVAGIDLAPARPPDTPATQPDPADWTLEKARDLTGRFLPLDVALGDEAADAGSGIAGGGQSAALAGVFGAEAYAEEGGQPGEVSYRFTITLTGRVSLIAIGLGAPPGGATAAAPDAAERCAGIEGWALGTSERVDRAAAIAEALEALDPQGTETPRQLHDWSQEFLNLTDQQRRAEPPPVARDANTLIVGAFNAYSLTMDLLSIAVVTGDLGAIDAAFVALDTATANLERAATLLDPAIQECA